MNATIPVNCAYCMVITDGSIYPGTKPNDVRFWNNVFGDARGRGTAAALAAAGTANYGIADNTANFHVFWSNAGTPARITNWGNHYFHGQRQVAINVGSGSAAGTVTISGMNADATLLRPHTNSASLAVTGRFAGPTAFEIESYDSTATFSAITVEIDIEG
jgi:hypothetical protein